MTATWSQVAPYSANGLAITAVTPPLSSLPLYYRSACFGRLHQWRDAPDLLLRSSLQSPDLESCANTQDRDLLRSASDFARLRGESAHAARARETVLSYRSERDYRHV